MWPHSLLVTGNNNENDAHGSVHVLITFEKEKQRTKYYSVCTKSQRNKGPWYFKECKAIGFYNEVQGREGLMFLTALRANRHHFIGEEIETYRLNYLPQITQLVKGIAVI